MKKVLHRMSDKIQAYFANVAENFNKLSSYSDIIAASSEAVCRSLDAGNKAIFCGNGGSAADSQHLAAELMGRFLIDRNPLPALALTTDTSALTAIGNDYGYKNVFSRQLRGIGVKGDVLIGLSTSGNSENVIEAMAVAREIGIITIGLTGESGGKMKELSDYLIAVPSTQTNHIQEMHIAIGHLICGIVESTLCQPK